METKRRKTTTTTTTTATTVPSKKEKTGSAKTTDTSDEIVDAIVTIMEANQGPMTQLAIRNALQKYSKQQINSTLYKETGTFQHQPGTPPLWSLVPKLRKEVGRSDSSEEKEEDYRNNTYVFIDLGNVHSLTAPLKEYPWVFVTGFADLHFSGEEPENTVRAKTQMPNAADVLLSKSFNEIYIRTGGQSSYIVCSKDSFFASYPFVYENTQIITVWDQLKLEL